MVIFRIVEVGTYLTIWDGRMYYLASVEKEEFPSVLDMDQTLRQAYESSEVKTDV